MNKWPGDRRSSGFLQSPTPIGRRQYLSQMDVLGLEASKRLEKVDTTTGSSLLPSPPKSLLPRLLASLELDVTQKLAVRKQQLLMYGKKKQELKELRLSLAADRFEEIRQLIGSQFGKLPKPETWDQFRQISVFLVTGLYNQLQAIMRLLLEDHQSLLESFGASLEVVNLSKPGKKRENQLMLKIHDPSSGVHTLVKKMLLLMNLEEVLTSRTFLDGWMCMLVELKLKDQIDPCLPRTFGSPPMLNRDIGTQTSMSPQLMRYLED